MRHEGVLRVLELLLHDRRLDRRSAIASKTSQCDLDASGKLLFVDWPARLLGHLDEVFDDGLGPTECRAKIAR
jgi:hypothetical protein